MALGVYTGASVAIGNEAGWAISVHRDSRDGVSPGEPVLVVTSATNDASVRATLPTNLGGGGYEIAVEGLTEEDQRALAPSPGRPPDLVRLYLFWRDANATLGGYLAGVAGVGDLLASFAEPPEEALVAVLSAVSVFSRRGEVRHELVIKAHERAWTRLARTPLDAPLKASSHLDAATELGGRAGVPIRTYAAAEAPKAASSDERLLPPLGIPAVAVLQSLGDRLEEASGRYGRGMLLIRDGTVHVGPRPVPLEGDKTLDAERGLIEVTSGAVLESGRRVYRLTLKGRPDLKPGDVARFEVPAQDVAYDGPGPRLSPGAALQAEVTTIAEVLAGPSPAESEASVRMYVSSVDHRLDRKKGFVTIVAGVSLDAEGNVWDPAPLGPGREPDPSADGAATARERLRGSMREAIAGSAPTEVGEVRNASCTGAQEPPSQTVGVWRGLEPSDGRPHGSRRLAIRRTDPDAIAGVPYLTPFAWGRCGLVLPRYPGTRVALLHRGGRPQEPLEVGALWPSGAGPDSRAGDWWLILPVGVPEDERAEISPDRTPAEHRGRATNDLVDADGNRVIEVGELTVRVGRDHLGDAGTRPERGEADGVTIEHAGADSRIVMKSDGTIVIDAGGNLELSAASDIKLSADNVRVTVKTAMDVS